MARQRFRTLLGLVLAGLVAVLALTACGSSDDSDGGATTGASTSNSAATTAGGAAGDAGAIDMAYLDEQTGALAYLATADTAKAAVDAANAAGGVNGHKVNLKVYDTGSSPQTGVDAVRRAIADKPDVVSWASSASADSGLKLLAKSGIPAIAFGATPNAFISDRFFSWPGKTIGTSSTAWVKYCVDDVGKKVAIPGGTTPGVETVVDQWAGLVKQIGGEVVYKKVGIDGTNNASITQAAKQIKDSGAQCVVSVLYPGSPQLQVALNQLGSDIKVVQNDSYGPEIEKQFGSSADGMVYANYFSSLQNTSNPGVKQYLADMKQFAPDANAICYCVNGYITAKVALHALGKVQGDVTAQKIVDAANTIDGYDVDGMTGPIKFPEFHTINNPCLGYSQMKDGKWTAIDGGGVNGMVCGEQYKAPS